MRKFVAIPGTYEIFHCASRGTEHDRRRIIRHLPMGLGVDPDQLQLVPPAAQSNVISSPDSSRTKAWRKRT